MNTTGIPSILTGDENPNRHTTHGWVKLTPMPMSLTGPGTAHGWLITEGDSPPTEDQLGATTPTDSPSTSPGGARGTTNQVIPTSSLRPWPLWTFTSQRR